VAVVAETLGDERIDLGELEVQVDDVQSEAGDEGSSDGFTG
jgi:hypothetical protein